MREILFRGKVIGGEEFIYGDYIRATPIPLIRVTEDDRSAYFGVIPETVGQYTGLTDKNGKKIFEGDILYVTALGNDHHQKGARTIALVKKYMGNTCLYLDGECHIGTTLYEASIAHNIDIIGNIHDNPKLFEVGD